MDHSFKQIRKKYVLINQQEISYLNYFFPFPYAIHTPLTKRGFFGILIFVCVFDCLYWDLILAFIMHHTTIPTKAQGKDDQYLL
jgi:hypothetical protein